MIKFNIKEFVQNFFVIATLLGASTYPVGNVSDTSE